MIAPPAAADTSLLGKIAELTEIIATDPQSTAFVALADTYRRLAMLQEAQEVAEQGIKTLPGYAPGYVMLGRICLERHDAARAEALLEKALGLDPANLPALHGLIRILLGRGEKGRAREFLQQGVRLHPQDNGLRQMLASFSPPPAGTGTPKTPPAASVGADEDPIATSTIAEIYLKQGLPQRALKVYRDLLQASPADQGLRRKIADLETLLAAGAPGSASPAAPPAGPPPAPVLPPETPQVRYLQLLDRWLAAVRERRTDVR